MKKNLLLTLTLFLFSISLIAQNLKPYKTDNGKWGLKNEKDSVVLKPTYDYISDFNQGLAKLFIGKLNDYKQPGNGLFGLVDKAGKVLLKPKYNIIEYFNDNIAKVFIGELNQYGEAGIGKYGFINNKGIEVIKLNYDALGDINKGVLTASKNHKWGIIDTSDNVLLDFTYDNISNLGSKYFKTFSGELFEDGRPKQGIFGIVKRDGTIIINPKYNFIYDYNKTWARVFKGKTHDGCNPIEGKYGFINEKGEEVIPLNYDKAERFSREGLAKVCKEGKCGFIDSTENAIIPLKYDHITYLRKGTAITFIGKTDDLGNDIEGKYGVVDKTGKELAPAIYDRINSVNNGYIVAIKDGMYGMLKDGAVFIPFEYNGLSSFSNGVAIVFKGETDPYFENPKGLFGLINMNGKLVVKMKYDMLRKYYKDLYIASKDHKYGVITKDEKVITKFQYDEILPIEENNGEYIPLTRMDDKYGCIDMEGKVILEPLYDRLDLGSFEQGFIIASINDKMGLFDVSGKEVLPIMYDYISVYDENKFSVSLDGEEFLVDRNNKKIEQ